MPIYTDNPYDDGFILHTTPLVSSLGIGPKVTKAIDGATREWLDEHPEATTTVEDGSISAIKLARDAVDGLPDMSATQRGVARVGAGLAMNNGALELNGGDIAPAVTAWLNAHPEATTTVQDNSILPIKLGFHIEYVINDGDLTIQFVDNQQNH